MIELCAEFSQSEATCTPFPDPRSHHVALVKLDPSRSDERALLRGTADRSGVDPGQAL
ncbi:MAG: hypothetical protein ABJB17_06630 [Burkholderiales bacterium]